MTAGTLTHVTLTHGAHWAEAYIGMPWTAGESDCWNLARRVWAERFGLTVAPVEIDPRDARAVRRSFGAPIDTPEAAARWTLVAGPDAAREGDGVLMAIGLHPCHVGIWVDPAMVLHSVEGAGVVCTPTSRLAGMGYRITAIYRGLECGL